MSEISSRSPIFVHSLFRSGSTYIFNAFRRAGEGKVYSCFQEPIHEIAFAARDDRDLLLEQAGDGPTQRLLRHPQMAAPYFQELYEIHDAWRKEMREDVIYGDYFGLHAIEETASYLNAIVKAAPLRPLIQDCRTPLRASALKKRLGGVHIFLWRNPWDQWWSLKATDYFDTAHQLILNAPQYPPAIAMLRDEVAFEPCSHPSIAEQFAFYGRRRPTAEASYLTFYTLWMLAMIEGLRSSDVSINIDRLSDSSPYRADVLSALGSFGIDGLDFGDCRSPHSPHGKEDASFFTPLEERAEAMLAKSGVTKNELSEIGEARRKYAPADPDGSARTLAVERENTRLRELARRIETRESELLAAEVARFEAYAAARGAELRNAAAALEAQSRAIGDLTARFERAKSEAVSLRAELSESLRRINAISDEVAFWNRAAQTAATEVKALRASASWRVTAPMRWASNATRSILRRPLEILFAMMRRIPLMRKGIFAVASLAPPVKRKLLHFENVRSGANADVTSRIASAEEPIELTASGERVYERLLAARRARRAT